MDKTCSICKLPDSDYLAYGEWKELNELKVHYFCLLLSTKMKQKGADDEGILGFLSKDIENCTRKHESVKCCYCSKGSATVYCQYGKGAKKCKKSFHVVCGVKSKCLFEFKDKFNSYCHEHHGIDDAQKCENDTRCYVCCKDIGDYDPILTIPSCCKKSYYHRKCLQKSALHYGYEFKCLTCGYNPEYREFIRGRGIFVPDQDPSWERDENAFASLLFTYARCDAKECFCPGGREVARHTPESKWSIRICQCCGAKGTHKFCQQNEADVFVCNECDEVEKRLKAKKKFQKHVKNNTISLANEEVVDCAAKNEKRQSEYSNDVEKISNSGNVGPVNESNQNQEIVKEIRPMIINNSEPIGIKSKNKLLNGLNKIPRANGVKAKTATNAINGDAVNAVEEILPSVHAETVKKYPFQNDVNDEGIIINDDSITYARCDAKECFCPGGREVARHTPESKWSIRICQCCGAKGTHKFCQQNEADVFVCNECDEVEKRLKAKKKFQKHVKNNTISLANEEVVDCAAKNEKRQSEYSNDVEKISNSGNVGPVNESNQNQEIVKEIRPMIINNSEPIGIKSKNKLLNGLNKIPRANGVKAKTATNAINGDAVNAVEEILSSVNAETVKKNPFQNDVNDEEIIINDDSSESSDTESINDLLEKFHKDEKPKIAAKMATAKTAANVIHCDTVNKHSLQDDSSESSDMEPTNDLLDKLYAVDKPKIAAKMTTANGVIAKTAANANNGNGVNAAEEILSSTVIHCDTVNKHSLQEFKPVGKTKTGLPVDKSHTDQPLMQIQSVNATGEGTGFMVVETKERRHRKRTRISIESFSNNIDQECLESKSKLRKYRIAHLFLDQ